MLHVGEAFHGSGHEAAHVTLLLGPNAVLATAFATAAASPGPGHVPFQVVLRPNVAVEPPTLFIAKAVLRDAAHERMTWGPAQAGVAMGLTDALLDAVLPTAARTTWLALALDWVDPDAADADRVYANNRAATALAATRACRATPTDLETLRLARTAPGNPFYTPPTP